MFALIRKSFAISFGISLGLGAAMVFGVTVTGTMNSFAAGDMVSAAMVNENFQSLKTAIEDAHEVPVGSIVAYHRDLFDTTPTLPTGWVECNGQVLSDTESSLDGKTIPDLNGEARFLRGGATSGTEEAAAFEQHYHQTGQHQLDNEAGNTWSNINGYASVGNKQFMKHAGLWANTYRPHTGNSGGSETRPINMSVIWIMKVK